MLVTEGDTEATASSRGKERSDPAHPSWSFAHARSSSGSGPPGQLCRRRVAARLFTAVPLPSSSPKQTDAYDLDHVIAAKLVA